MSQQQHSLQDQLKALVQIQELDFKIDQLKKNQGGMPAALKTQEDSFNKAKALVDAKNAALAEVEKVQRQARAAIDINQDRVNRSNTRMESVQNSQEYAAMNKELDQLKKLSITLHEQLKKAEVDFTAGQQELAKLVAQFEQIQQKRDEQRTQMSAELAQSEGAIAKIVADRAQFIPQVENRLLAQYDRVRGSRAGLGISPAVSGRCKACNIMIPPQQYNEILRGKTLHSCSSCHRILFVAEPTGC